MKPARVQLSRKKGWRMPENTVKVDRSTKWGNPFRPTMIDDSARGAKQGLPIGQAGAAQAFRKLMVTKMRQEPDQTRALLDELRGKNLACWCKLDEACHADVLLELANPDPAAICSKGS